MTSMNDAARSFADAFREVTYHIEELQRRTRNNKRPGTISEVDVEKRMARVKLGTSPTGQDFLSPWVPWDDGRSGTIKEWKPPSVGEQVFYESDGGDVSNGVIRPYTFSNQNPANHNVLDEKKTSIGESHMLHKADGFEFTCPNFKIICGGTIIEAKDGELTITTDLVKVIGNRMEHNGKNVGHTHKHEEVMKGADLTGHPVE
jgi:phage baseplate assembly protein gpV